MVLWRQQQKRIYHLGPKRAARASSQPLGRPAAKGQENHPMKTATILPEIISALGAFASILWLFINPGWEPFVVSLVTSLAILGVAIRAQLKLARVLDESLLQRLQSIQEIRKVTDFIPKTTAESLLNKLSTDANYLRRFSSIIQRLFGLRRELIPNLEPDLVTLIDNELEPLCAIESGGHEIKSEKLQELSILAIKLSEVVRLAEHKLTQEHRERFGIK